MAERKDVWANARLRRTDSKTDSGILFISRLRLLLVIDPARSVSLDYAPAHQLRGIVVDPKNFRKYSYIFWHNLAIESAIVDATGTSGIYSDLDILIRFIGLNILILPHMAPGWAKSASRRACSGKRTRVARAGETAATRFRVQNHSLHRLGANNTDVIRLRTTGGLDSDRCQQYVCNG